MPNGLSPAAFILPDVGVDRDPRVRADFEFRSGGVRVGWYKFISYDIDKIQATRLWLDHLVVTITKGPASMDELPAHETDAVLRTHAATADNWAARSRRLQLLLGGSLTAEWDVEFPVALYPFRLDGTWTLAG
ncbi:hypothetical protein C1I98_33945 [Spongiactinospora gelatinilytica]|uniref:Uncharacterized protein n=1 Tax=Spongiactinospora gelatinilytica TaxID=2666298 RepID=A0A2W2FMD4_9ACTN|nr:hypothetical protein [Spongiactinospora gelatinilytica]PZG26470.1 hypothetical protein C1I98_33945 [Spongiactinospora gelatinilytica]